MHTMFRAPGTGVHSRIPAVLRRALAWSCLSAALAVSGTAAASQGPLGRVERVRLVDPGVVLKARIDTGARTTSVDATILEIVPGDGDRGARVRFRLRDAPGPDAVLEREVIAWTRIKGKGTDQYIRRPVVELALCVGGKRLEGRVNLADRSRFLYPVLVGRNFLAQGDFLVDSRAIYTAPPECPEPG